MPPLRDAVSSALGALPGRPCEWQSGRHDDVTLSLRRERHPSPREARVPVVRKTQVGIGVGRTRREMTSAVERSRVRRLVPQARTRWTSRREASCYCPDLPRSCRRTRGLRLQFGTVE